MFFHVSVKTYYGMIYNIQLKHLSVTYPWQLWSLNFVWELFKNARRLIGRMCVENTGKRDRESGEESTVIVTHGNDLREITIHFYLSF